MTFINCQLYLTLGKQFRKNVSSSCLQGADAVCLMILLSLSCIYGLSFKLPHT
jgi:hypothetical protein